jgi:hypothetical protein
MADDGLKRIKLSEDYAGQKAGSIYVCDPLRAEWLLENDHGREATKADLEPKPKRVKVEDEPEPEEESPKPRRRKKDRSR